LTKTISNNECIPVIPEMKEAKKFGEMMKLGKTYKQCEKFISVPKSESECNN
jgi:hypothetical protein